LTGLVKESFKAAMKRVPCYYITRIGAMTDMLPSTYPACLECAIQLFNIYTAADTTTDVYKYPTGASEREEDYLYAAAAVVKAPRDAYRLVASKLNVLNKHPKAMLIIQEQEDVCVNYFCCSRCGMYSKPLYAAFNSLEMHPTHVCGSCLGHVAAQTYWNTTTPKELCNIITQKRIRNHKAVSESGVSFDPDGVLIVKEDNIDDD
jgi:hypothetical protein